MRCHLLSAALALTLAAAPAVSQKPQRQMPAKPEQAPVAGLPLYTADGKAVGRVLAMGLGENDEQVLVAEIERPLGLGPEAIAIPMDMLVRKPGRIELTLTEAEVDARLGHGERKR
jgi:hypothetical protein